MDGDECPVMAMVVNCSAHPFLLTLMLLSAEIDFYPEPFPEMGSDSS